MCALGLELYLCFWRSEDEMTTAAAAAAHWDLISSVTAQLYTEKSLNQRSFHFYRCLFSSFDRILP